MRETARVYGSTHTYIYPYHGCDVTDIIKSVRLISRRSVCVMIPHRYAVLNAAVLMVAEMTRTRPRRDNDDDITHRYQTGSRK